MLNVKTKLTSILFLALLVLRADAVVLIDFGNSSTFRGVTTPGNWNSVGFGFLANLVDVNGNPTAIDYAPDGMGATDSFNSIAGGTSNPVTAAEIATAQGALSSSLGLLASGEAAIDYFLSNNGTTSVGRFQIQQVTPGQLYDLTFYGSKQYVAVGNTQTRYSVFSDSTYGSGSLLGSGVLTTGTTNGTGNRTDVLTLQNLMGPANANNIFYVQFEGVNVSTAGVINSMSIQAVPEPSTSTMLIAGALGLLFSRHCVKKGIAKGILENKKIQSH